MTVASKNQVIRRQNCDRSGSSWPSWRTKPQAARPQGRTWISVSHWAVVFWVVHRRSLQVPNVEREIGVGVWTVRVGQCHLESLQTTASTECSDSFWVDFDADSILMVCACVFDCVTTPSGKANPKLKLKGKKKKYKECVCVVQNVQTFA